MGAVGDSVSVRNWRASEEDMLTSDLHTYSKMYTDNNQSVAPSFGAEIAAQLHTHAHIPHAYKHTFLGS